MPLMFSEMKRTALMLCEGKSDGEIVSLSMDKNICGKIKSALCAAGLGKRKGASLLIRKPIVNGELRHLFEEADKVYLRAMLILIYFCCCQPW